MGGGGSRRFPLSCDPAKEVKFQRVFQPATISPSFSPPVNAEAEFEDSPTTELGWSTVEAGSR